MSDKSILVKNCVFGRVVNLTPPPLAKIGWISTWAQIGLTQPNDDYKRTTLIKLKRIALGYTNFYYRSISLYKIIRLFRRIGNLTLSSTLHTYLTNFFALSSWKATPCTFFSKYESYYISSIQLVPEEFLKVFNLLNFKLWFGSSKARTEPNVKFRRKKTFKKTLPGPGFRKC